MSDLLTEFTWIDPEEVHLVGSPANGFPAPLLAKAADAVSESADELIKEFVDGLCGVTGCSVCHVRYSALKASANFVEKARLRAKERGKLSASLFAFPKGRKEPINDAAHVRAAMARFDQVEGVTAEEKKEAARRILARAKHLGIEVGDDTAVARAAKQLAPERSVPESEGESQTRAVDAGPEGSEPSPDAEDGGEPQVGFPADRDHGEGDHLGTDGGRGQGDTAPDKSLPSGEAEGQTHDDIEGNAHKAGVGDGTGDPAPNGEEEARSAEEEGEAQTRDDVEGNAHKGAADSDPGSSEWEHKDVALGEKAERLVTQLAGVVHTFTEREKAEGGASKELWRAARTARQLLAHPNTLRKVAEKMPDTSELVQVLGEYDAARRAEKKARKMAEAKKAAKQEKKDAKVAKQAAKASGAPTAKELKALREQVEDLRSKDGRRITLNEAGAVAILRGPEADSVFKALDERVDAARKADAEAKTDLEKMRSREELRSALQQRATAKLVAADNARQRGLLPTGRFGPNSAQLFDNVNSIGDDTGIHYQDRR